MRAILTAIVATFRVALRMMLGLAKFPGRLLGMIMGVPPDCGDIQPPAPAEDMEEIAPDNTLDRQAIYERVAAAVLSWCADSLIHGQPAPLPRGLPIVLRQWLPGLSRKEAEVVLNADKASIAAHLQGFYDIAGLRHVGPLPTTEDWPAKPRKHLAGDIAIVCSPEVVAPARP